MCSYCIVALAPPPERAQMLFIFRVPLRRARRARGAPSLSVEAVARPGTWKKTEEKNNAAWDGSSILTASSLLQPAIAVASGASGASATPLTTATTTGKEKRKRRNRSSMIHPMFMTLMKTGEEAQAELQAASSKRTSSLTVPSLDPQQRPAFYERVDQSYGGGGFTSELNLF